MHVLLLKLDIHKLVCFSKEKEKRQSLDDVLVIVQEVSVVILLRIV